MLNFNLRLWPFSGCNWLTYLSNIRQASYVNYYYLVLGLQLGHRDQKLELWKSSEINTELKHMEFAQRKPWSVCSKSRHLNLTWIEYNQISKQLTVLIFNYLTFTFDVGLKDWRFVYLGHVQHKITSIITRGLSKINPQSQIPRQKETFLWALCSHHNSQDEDSF